MWGVITRFLKDKRNSFIGFLVGAVAFLEMYIALYPSIKESAAQLNDLIQSYPDAFFSAFGIDKAELSFTSVESYLATEQFSFIWPIMLIIFVIGLANAIAVSDIDKGTSEFIFAQPISRVKLFFSRYIAGLIYISLFVFTSVYVSLPLLQLHNISYSIDRFHSLAATSFLFALAIYSVGSFFSVVLSEKGKASFAAGGLIIFMYVLNVVSGLKDSLSDLKYFSFIYYYNPSTALNKGQFVDWAVPVFVGFSVVITVLAAIRFNNRDLV